MKVLKTAWKTFILPQASLSQCILTPLKFIFRLSLKRNLQKVKVEVAVQQLVSVLDYASKEIQPLK